MNYKSGLYLIENKLTGEFYGGSSVNLKRRWSHHKCSVINKRYMCPKLHRAMERDGIDNFSFKVLMYCDPTQLDVYEQNWLDKNVGKIGCYNIAVDAKSEWRGIKFTEEHRKSISEALKGHECSEETREKIGNANRGRVVSAETRKKLSERNRGERNPMFGVVRHPSGMAGKHHSEETKKKMSEARRLYLKQLEI